MFATGKGAAAPFFLSGDVGNAALAKLSNPPSISVAYFLSG